jgi:hypothetical protein
MESLLETLGSEKGVKQIDEQGRGGDSADDIVHGSAPYNLSQALVKPQHTKKKRQQTAI